MLSPKKEEEKTEEEGIIKLNKEIINNSIEKNGKYEKDSTFIRRWEGDDTDSYIAKISSKKMSYIGILNGHFEREGYGINSFSNGDQYFGYYENNKRNRHGIYFFSPQKKNNTIYEELYYGFWKENQKDNHGLYLWLNEPENNYDFSKSNFDCYIGDIKEDRFTKGTYLTKKNDEYYLYYGYFDENGRKSDKNALFYSSSDRLIKGEILNDNFIEGYVAFFNSETGYLTNFNFCKFGIDGTVTNVKQEKDLIEEIGNVDQIKNEMNTFRNVILEYDYFTNIYERYKEIREFIKDNMNTIEVLDDKDKFPEIIKLCVGYNSLNLFGEIEKKVYGQKSSI